MTVYLIGAGPGDPGLMTVRGVEIMSRADVVLFDRLVSRDLLDLAPEAALRIDVGKHRGESGGGRQAEINRLIVEHGLSKEVVVRLKGGDPYVFGRGGEEAEALLGAEVDFEVVPGVSSAFAVAARAGVAVTHRGVSRSVTIVTGHLGDGEAPSQGPDWDSIARGGGTLVIMMGMEHRAEIARRLVAAGRSPETPVLVVQNGTTHLQRQARTTLEELKSVELGAPSIIVVGEVAGLDLSPAPKGPLSGMTVVATRAREQSGPLVGALAREGARVLLLPVIGAVGPLDGGEALRSAALGLARWQYGWVVFTSSNAVERLLSAVHDARDLAGASLAVVGSSTAAALASHGLVADLTADSSTAEGLVAAMAAAPEAGGAEARILFPRAEDAREVLASGLRDKGWDVDEVVVYRTVAAGPEHGATRGDIEAACAADVVTFTSPSTVRFFLELAAGRRVPSIVACIGPTTADAARAAGLQVDVVAEDHSAMGLVRALVAHVTDPRGS